MTCLRWLLCFFCLLSPPSGLAEATREAAPVLHIAGLGRATAQLDGPWAFQLGDDARWAAPDFDDRPWEQIATDKGWGEQGHFAYSGFAWYRRHIDVPSTPGTPPELALFLPHVEDVYQVYWNGRPVGQQGTFPPRGSWPNDPLPQTFQLGPQRAGVLAIRVWKAPLISYDAGLGGGLGQTPTLGTPGAIGTLSAAASFGRLRGMLLRMGLALFYLLVTLAALAAWLQHRQQPLFLWLSLFALGSSLQAGWWHSLLGISYVQEAMLATVYQPLEDIATWFLLIYLLGLRDNPRVMRLARLFALLEIALLALDGLAVACWAPGWPQWLDGIISEVILLPELFPVVLVCFAWRKQLPFATWLVAAFALLTDLTLEVGAFLSQGDRFTHWTLWKKLITPVFYVAGNGVSLEHVAATLLLLSLVFAVYRSALQESERQQGLQQEFASAQELQRVLIPDELPSVLGYEVTSAYRPALEVGGDFFQLIPQGGGSALLIVGDVSGKGLAAAMAVSLIVGTIRTLAEQLPSPAEMLAGINRRLTGKLHGGFATCVVVFLDADGSFLLSSAGHPGPFLNGEEVMLSPALPLGFSLDAEYGETEGLLQTGDQLTLFSDGLLEARNRDGELFGFDRIQARTKERAEASELANAAIAFGQEDDITVVIVTRLRVGAESRTSLAAPALLPRPGGTA